MATQPLPSSNAPYIDESRFERVDGRLVERPMPGDTHSETQDKVKSLLQQRLATQPFKVLSEWSITRPSHAAFDEPDYITPDVLVAYLPYERTAKGHLIRQALLAIEIVSPGQSGLFRKSERYGAWGVEHVWIIDPQTREAFEFHGGNQFALVKDRLTAGELHLTLSDIFPID